MSSKIVSVTSAKFYPIQLFNSLIVFFSIELLSFNSVETLLDFSPTLLKFPLISLSGGNLSSAIMMINHYAKESYIYSH